MDKFWIGWALAAAIAVIIAIGLDLPYWACGILGLSAGFIGPMLGEKYL